MLVRGIGFKQIKHYYGLKGNSSKECVPQLEELLNNYKLKLFDLMECAFKLCKLMIDMIMNWAEKSEDKNAYRSSPSHV